MSQSVTIKSNKYGINLVLDADMSFADLIKAVVEKFKASANFFKNAKLAISFEGRHLSDEEQQQIIAAIEENTTIEILCIVESGTEQEAIMKEQVEAFNEAVQKQCENVATVSVPEQFYRGTLRSGQVITSESSVTIIGDVNPGAKIIAQGNIVILGALKGNVHAGCTGDRSCFVFALDMQPIQIQIGDLIAKSPDEPQPKHRVRRKEIAFEEKLRFGEQVQSSFEHQGDGHRHHRTLLGSITRIHPKRHQCTTADQ